MLRVLNQAYDNPLKKEETATNPLAGGILQHGYQCGMIWGASLAAGAEVYKRYGSGPVAETMAVMASQKAVESFREQTGEINCYEITEIDRSSSAMQMISYFLIKGGTIGCFKMAARFAPVAFDTIEQALDSGEQKLPDGPVSCTAELARKMGATDQQAVMAAGLAGGIGLCGGACGALGAAIWMRELQNGSSKVNMNDPAILTLIETFLKASDYEFKCSEIVGRSFGDSDDHAAYIRSEGCNHIIDALGSG